ncbi:MAG: glucose-1-phosphate adenylyltransferase [Anaerolineales bacterium]|nr:glucose-1-phosphate adenylyltransferase [Anaerolineales bacterium]
MPQLNNVLAVILGGGRGTRLYPLTKERAKPAVPIAGKYRLIDIPISNCINAGFHRIAVLTQFNSVSLHRHISQTYNFDNFSRGWVQILAAEQRSDSMDWYQGTADAVRKQLIEIKSADAEHVIILAGDHLYRMDYDVMLAYHIEKDADITIAVQPVRREDAGRLGILKDNQAGRIIDFVEKPTDPDVLADFVSRKEDQVSPYIGSMGMYLFKTQVLIDVLENTTYDDFGGDIVPAAIDSHEVYGYNFEGFWEDIGTIRSFYETNLSLTQPNPPFNFHDPTDPIYTRPRFLPGSIVNGAKMNNVFMAEGCQVGAATIENTVVGLRSQIADNVKLSSTILMGADFYDTPESIQECENIPLGIGGNCEIENAIIDKNARVGEGVKIKAFPPDTELDAENWSVRDGIVIITKNAIIYPDTYIGPE